MPGMDDQRIGRALRVLRHRRGLRQSDVAAAAGTSQSVISKIEAGRLRGCSIDILRRVFAAVDAGFEGDVRWRGSALDRLLDARHASLIGVRVELLERDAWDPIVEATYRVFGERGSIDVLAARAPERAVVVEEVKSELATVEGTLRKLDEKARLVRESIAMERFGWQPECVGRLLVLPGSSTSRRQVQRHGRVLDRALPARGREVRDWLRQPVGDIAGIVFLPDIGTGDLRRGRGGIHRVRTPRSPDPVP